MCIGVELRARRFRIRSRRHGIMGSTEETKGRIEQAAGDLTDDKDLKRQGQIDEASGKAKKKANDLVDNVAKGLKNKS
jgi:uncharacterized protein YjbJ (UPF0337 family)